MIGLHQRVPSAPPGFEDEFVRGGWRGVERAYGAPTDLILKWIDRSGREQLYRRRADYVQARVRTVPGPQRTAVVTRTGPWF